MSEEVEKRPICEGCGCEHDPDYCWCGDAINHDAMWAGHAPIPMGCRCGFADNNKEEDKWIS